MYETDDAAFFAAFRAGTLDPAAFDHRAHLRAAVCALARLPFLEACIAIRDGLGHLAIRVGRPALYHETMTVAMLALVADALADDIARGAATPSSAPSPGRAPTGADLDGFIARHPELVDRTSVLRRYRRDTFEGDAARRRFRLPDATAEPVR